MQKQERDEKIELYGKGFELLIKTLIDIPPEIWKFKPAPKEWSIHEILVHLADSETNAALRARKLIVAHFSAVLLRWRRWALRRQRARRRRSGASAIRCWKRMH